jgi:hypothetical protein
VPPRIARGNVRAGSRTLPTGAVAFSKPSIANKVSDVAVATPPMVNGTAASGSSVPPPPWLRTSRTTTPSRGTSLIAIVRRLSPPDTRTPSALTSVRKEIDAMLKTMTVLSPNIGLIRDVAAPKAIATAAFETQHEIQNAQVTTNPMTGPKSCSIKD